MTDKIMQLDEVKKFETKTTSFLVEKFGLTEAVSKNLFFDAYKGLTSFTEKLGPISELMILVSPFHPAIIFDDFLYVCDHFQTKLYLKYKEENFLPLVLGKDSTLLEMFENGSFQINDSEYENDRLIRLIMTVNGYDYRYTYKS